MGFNFFKWIQKVTTPASEDGTVAEVTKGDFLEVPVENIAGLEVYLQRMAFWSCVRKIGAAVAACEIKTYRMGKEVQAKEYWAWNYDPNPNQTHTEFIQRLVGQLYMRQEAIVVETADGYRYVAEGYSVEKHLSGNIYRDITADGESIPGVFASKDIIRITIEGDSIRRMMTAVASAEGQLMKSAASSFTRNNGMRGTLEIDDLAEADPDFEETYNDLVNDKFKKYFTSDNAVLPLFKGYNYTERNSSSGKTTQPTTRDIRAMMDDILDLTARAMNMPLSIAQGKNVTDADWKEFMTSVVKPIAMMLEQEINRKMYGQRQVTSQGTYTEVDMGGVRYTDIFDVANPIDKLIGSGAFCINDIRVRLGLDIIDEPWAWQHWMTKNYSTVEDLNDGMGDGKKDNPADQPGEGEINE